MNIAQLYQFIQLSIDTAQYSVISNLLVQFNAKLSTQTWKLSAFILAPLAYLVHWFFQALSDPFHSIISLTTLNHIPAQTI